MLGFENSCLLDTSSQVGIRSSRRLYGLNKVTAEDAWNFVKCDDAIARSSWEIDVWPADSYTKPAVAHEDKDYARRGLRLREEREYFDIPYGCIVCEGIDNLLMGGRCISAEHLAESSLRIQQTCMSIGQAAGTSAAFSIEAGVTPAKLDGTKVTARLKSDRENVIPAFDIIPR